MVIIVQVMFRDSKVLEDIAWKTMVLLLNGKGGGYRGIGIVQVL